MQQLAGTPTGTGWSRAVEHVEPVLAIGRPIGDRPPAVRRGDPVGRSTRSSSRWGRTCSTAAGPRRAASAGQVARQRLAAAEHRETAGARPAGVEQQPPGRRGGLQERSPGARASSAASRCRRGQPPRRRPAPARRRSAAAGRAPGRRCRRQSEVTASSRVAGAEAGRSRDRACRKLTSAPCGTCTPLGWPVEPEV